MRVVSCLPCFICSFLFQLAGPSCVLCSHHHHHHPNPLQLINSSWSCFPQTTKTSTTTHQPHSTSTSALCHCYQLTLTPHKALQGLSSQSLSAVFVRCLLDSSGRSRLVSAQEQTSPRSTTKTTKCTKARKCTNVRETAALLAVSDVKSVARLVPFASPVYPSASHASTTSQTGGFL